MFTARNSILTSYRKVSVESNYLAVDAAAEKKS